MTAINVPAAKTAIEELLEKFRELPYLEDEERRRVRRILEAEGISLDRVERGGVIYALEKVLQILSREE